MTTYDALIPADGAGLDRLLHELDLCTGVDEDELVAYTRQHQSECFVCALIDWVRGKDDDCFGFGAALTVATEIEWDHFLDSPVHLTALLRERLEYKLAERHERLFRHDEEMAYYSQEATRLQSICERQAMRMQELGLDPFDPDDYGESL